MKALYQWSFAVLAGAVLGAMAVQGLRAQAKPPVYILTVRANLEVNPRLR